MANALIHRVVAPAIGIPADQRAPVAAAALRRVSPGKADRPGDRPADAALPRSFRPRQEIDLLRRMLADHNQRLVDKDSIIDDLRRRLAEAEDERRTILRQLNAVLADKRAGGGRLRGATRAFGRLLDRLGESLQPQSRRSERERDTAPAARALAEKALLDQIARQHLRWVRGSDGGDG
jgi:hypothetical protein